MRYEKKRTELRYLIMKQSLQESENFLLLFQNSSSINNNSNNIIINNEKSNTNNKKNNKKKKNKENNLVEYYMNIASKELDGLIKQIKNKKLSELKRYNILLFIFNLCDITKNGSITRSQFRQLVLYIFRFSIPKSALNKDLNIIDPQYRNSIPLKDYIAYTNKCILLLFIY